MLSPALSGSGNLSITGGGNNEVWFNGDHSAFAGTLTVAPATGAILGAASATSAGAKYAVNGTLYFGNGSAPGTYNLGELSGSGIVTGDNVTSFTVQVGGLNADSTFSGVIGGGAGTMSFIKTGSGSLTLSGANTYAGGTTLNGGTLRYGVTNALPTSGAVAVNGGELDLATASGTIGTLNLVSGSVLGSSTSSLSANSYTLASGTVAVNLGDRTASTLIVGAGNVILSGNNTYTGGTTISGGTLQLGTGGADGSIDPTPRGVRQSAPSASIGPTISRSPAHHRHGRRQQVGTERRDPLRQQRLQRAHEHFGRHAGRCGALGATPIMLAANTDLTVSGTVGNGAIIVRSGRP